MSVEATGWAFRQKVPPKPKMLLLALADQTDEVTGHVCYGKRDAKHLATKSSCSERSFFRYMAALVRNGYARSISGKAKGEANQYYLCLDRPVAASLSEWQWKGSEGDEPPDDTDDGTPDDTPQDVGEGMPNWQTPDTGENGSEDDQIGRGGLPQDGRPYVSESIKHHTRARAENRSTSFSRQAQDAEIENRSINRAAESAGAKTFVIEGSRAWNDWLTYRRNVLRLAVWTLPTCTGPNGSRGWYMPTLFPPQAQPPPESGTLCTAQDMNDFK